MIYYIDCEFLEGEIPQRVLGFNIPKWISKPNNTIQLISIGLVCEDGREYYAVSKDFNLYEAWNRYDMKPQPNELSQHHPDYWIRDNVLKVIFNDMCSLEFDRTGIVHHEFTYSDFKELLNTHGKSNKVIAQEIKEFVNSETVTTTGTTTIELTKESKDNIERGYLKPEFYGYYSDYDWVCFCWLFGKMIDLPKGFPMYCNDLKQELDKHNYNRLVMQKEGWSGILEVLIENQLSYRVKVIKESDIDKQPKKGVTFNIDKNDVKPIANIKEHPNYPKQTVEHSAIHDARWNKQLHEFLKTL